MDYRDKLDSRVLRRIDDDEFEDELNNLLDVVSPCDFNDSGEFISDMCDLLKDNFLDNIEINPNPKTKDVLYFYLVDKFGGYLIKIYKNEEC